jgi:hypothetical protein
MKMLPSLVSAVVVRPQARLDSSADGDLRHVASLRLARHPAHDLIK